MIKEVKRKRVIVKATSKSETNNPRTNSFSPIWAGTFDPNTTIKVHTLILGTHPSITSLGKNQYYGHPMKYVHDMLLVICVLIKKIFLVHLTHLNHLLSDSAFWWIAGDCLGFRRDR